LVAGHFTDHFQDLRIQGHAGMGEESHKALEVVMEKAEAVIHNGKVDAEKTRVKAVIGSEWMVEKDKAVVEIGSDKAEEDQSFGKKKKQNTII